MIGGMPQTFTPDRLLPDIVSTVQDLLPQLRWMLPEPDVTGPHSGTSRPAPGPSEPWNTEVAHAYWCLWIGTGNVVNALRRSAGLELLEPAPRGYRAASMILDYAPAAEVGAVELAIRRLERWISMARALPGIDEAEPWVPVPGTAGVPPPCPYCDTFGLRMLKRRGEVRCFYPGCTDRDGKATRARMEPGRMTGEARLIFGDGTMMHWAGA